MVSRGWQIVVVVLVIDVLITLGIMASNPFFFPIWLLLNAIVAIPLLERWKRKGRLRTLQQRRASLRKFDSRRQNYGIPHLTLNGEWVRSGEEKQVADYLHRKGIAYQYERPIRTRSNGLIHPDFYLTDYRVLVEYWGMVNCDDKHTRQGYIKDMEWKMARYHENGNKLISIYPEDLGNLDYVFEKKMKDLSLHIDKKEDRLV